jgi:hypothetical protein
VPQVQAVHEEFFLWLPDPENGSTTLSEGAQTGHYMILKVFRKG